MEYHLRNETRGMRHRPGFSMWLKLRKCSENFPPPCIIIRLKIFFLPTRGKSDTHCVQKRLLNFLLQLHIFFPPRLQSFLIGGKATMLCIAYASRDSRGVIP
jgi:hypothetical protein